MRQEEREKREKPVMFCIKFATTAGIYQYINCYIRTKLWALLPFRFTSTPETAQTLVPPMAGKMKIPTYDQQVIIDLYKVVVG